MSTGNGEMRDLAQRIEDGYAPAWRPEEGDSIVGYVQEISIGQSDYGEYPIVTLIVEGGEADGQYRSIHAFHSTLQNQLIEKEPTIGEKMATKYNGLRLPKGKTMADVPTHLGGTGTSKEDPRYHDYMVMVDRAPTDTWAKFRKNRRTEPAREQG